MEIVVFGATGRTGRRVVEQAVAAGHQVRAACRSGRPASGSTSSSAVEWVRADVREPSAVSSALDGMQAVVSAVGAGTGRAATTVYSAGARNILDVMAAGGPERVAVVSAAPVAPAGFPAWQRALVLPVLRVFFGGSYRDMARMEAELSRRPQLAWVCLRPPFLRDGPATGHYRIDPDHPAGGSITTGDLAAALLDAVLGPPAPWPIAYVAG